MGLYIHKVILQIINDANLNNFASFLISIRVFRNSKK